MGRFIWVFEIKIRKFSNILMLAKDKIIFQRNFLSPFQIEVFNPYAIVLFLCVPQFFLIMSGVTWFTERFYQAHRNPERTKVKEKI